MFGRRGLGKGPDIGVAPRETPPDDIFGALRLFMGMQPVSPLIVLFFPDIPLRLPSLN